MQLPLGTATINAMNNIAIVGYGRFGALLCDLLAPNYEIAVVENEPSRRSVAREKSLRLIELQDLPGFDTVIFAVPISLFENVVAAAAKYISNDQLVMDMCSVKVHPARVMQKYLPGAKLIATHPMFGPDSASKGLSGLQVAICPLRANEAIIQEVCSLWESLGLDVIMTTPEAHDQDSVLSQAFTYSIANIILGMHLADVKLTTRSFNDITDVARLSANDSDQLFHDMLFYNPYFQTMKQNLIASIGSTMDRLSQIEEEQRAAGIFADQD